MATWPMLGGMDRIWLSFWIAGMALVGLPLIGAVYYGISVDHAERMACVAARGNWEGRPGVGNGGANTVEGCRFAATKP